MSYVIWLSKDKKEWSPLPQERTKTTHHPKEFSDLLKAEVAANEALCDGDYLYAQVLDRHGEVVSEIECVE
jgi:hypothetical protein